MIKNVSWNYSLFMIMDKAGHLVGKVAKARFSSSEKAEQHRASIKIAE